MLFAQVVGLLTLGTTAMKQHSTKVDGCYNGCKVETTCDPRGQHCTFVSTCITGDPGAQNCSANSGTTGGCNINGVCS